jgi:hypothetical protein
VDSGLEPQATGGAGGGGAASTLYSRHRWNCSYSWRGRWGWRGGPHAGSAGGSGVVVLRVPNTAAAVFSSGVATRSYDVVGYTTYEVQATTTTGETVTFYPNAFLAEYLVVAVVGVVVRVGQGHLVAEVAVVVDTNAQMTPLLWLL